MTVPDFQTLMLPALRRLAASRLRTGTLVDAFSEEFGLSSEERAALLPSGRQPTMANRTHWALAYLSKAGLVRRVSRGEYEASPEGKDFLAKPPDKITVALLMDRYPAIRSFRDSGRTASAEIGPVTAADIQSSGAVVAATPEDTIGHALKVIEAKLRDDLLSHIFEKPPEFFEEVVVDLLLAMGYGSTAEDAGEALGRSGDGGVDGVIREDRLGLDLIYVQAKRYKDNPVTADHLRSFAGALDDKGARKGVFITTSRFTNDAQGFAKRQQMKRIVLVDGEMLSTLMLRHDVGVRVDRTIVLKKVDLDYFDPDAA
jgi:restriction system protein